MKIYIIWKSSPGISSLRIYCTPEKVISIFNQSYRRNFVISNWRRLVNALNSHKFLIQIKLLCCWQCLQMVSDQSRTSFPIKSFHKLLKANVSTFWSLFDTFTSSIILRLSLVPFDLRSFGKLSTKTFGWGVWYKLARVNQTNLGQLFLLQKVFGVSQLGPDRLLSSFQFPILMIANIQKCCCRQHGCAEADWLWLCQGDPHPGHPPDTLLHTLLCR